MKEEELNKADIAASFQAAVVEVLVSHSMLMCENYGYKTFALAGGVASNSAIRAAFDKACKERDIKLVYPDPILCTDNAAMIGAAGYYEYLKGVRMGYDLNAVPNLKLGDI